MIIGAWGVLVLLAASPPECAERFELRPDESPLRWSNPHIEAMRDDLVCPGEGAPVLMVMNASIKGMPEFAVFKTLKPCPPDQ